MDGLTATPNFAEISMIIWASAADRRLYEVAVSIVPLLIS